MTLELWSMVLAEKTLKGEERLFMLAVADCNGQVRVNAIADWCNSTVDEAYALIHRMDEAGWISCVDGLIVVHDLYAAFCRSMVPGRFKNDGRPYIKISKQKRAAVYDRDGHACHYCGSDQNLTLDHKIPVSKGGSNDIDNLVTCCKFCNSSKGTKDYEAFVAGMNAE